MFTICPCVIEQSHKATSSEESKYEQISSSETANDIFSQEHTGNPTLTKSTAVFGKVVLGLTGAVALGLVAITTPFVTPALRKVCLPYVPATERQIANVLQMCRPMTRPEKCSLVDLGSGDGRVVVAAAKQGYKAHGIELNPWLVWYSKLQAKIQGVSHLATFSRQDLWKVNLSEYDNIVIFGVSEMMDQLQSKVEKEAQNGSHIIACRFPFSWIPQDFIQEGIDSVWLYKKPFRSKS